MTDALSILELRSLAHLLHRYATDAGAAMSAERPGSRRWRDLHRERDAAVELAERATEAADHALLHGPR